MTDLTSLFALIAATRPENAWPSLEKCQALAAIICAIRPCTVVEIGVWTGDSLIPQLLALRALGAGKAWAIDPWDTKASLKGQEDKNQEWWGKVDHQVAYETFQDRLRLFDLKRFTKVVRAPSDKVDLDEIGVIDVLHIDGNHAAQAVRDVDRFAAQIPVGGVLVLDDLNWEGGHVVRARDVALQRGFRENYPLGTGCVMRRIRT